MIEIDQPIKENGLLKMSPTVESAESSESVVEEVIQQNGTTIANKDSLPVVTKLTSPEATADDSNEAKGLEDDAMERLMYTDLDDGDEEESADKDSTEKVELGLNISDTLIENIIQLNKDSKRAESDTEVDPDRLESEESSDISPSSGQSSNQTAAEQADAEDTNGAVSITEDDTLTEVNEDLATDAGTKEVVDIDEESESILLQEDNVELGDDLDVDESLLLDDEDVDMGESAIQIEDSVLVSAEGTVEGTDGSVTIDESGLSILNTAAVDIADMTVDDSVEVSLDAKIPESTEDTVSTVADNQKTTEEQIEVPEEEEAPLSPDISDLIIFPNMEKKESAPELNGEATEPKDNVPEMSDLIKFPDDSNTGMEVDKPSSRSASPEMSDLIKFDSVAEEVKEQDDKKLLAEPVLESKETVPEKPKSPIDSVSEDEKSVKPNNSEALQQDKVDVDEKVDDAVKQKESEDKKDEEKKEKDDDAEVESDDPESEQHTCRQALQAADEEDLLEMMEEPEQMEGDDEPEVEEDLDDNSSESGSNKQVEGDEEDEFEGSDYMGAEEDESSRNQEDQEETGGEEVQVEESDLADGEPPLKRKCSIDVREAQEEESEKSEVVKEKAGEVDEKIEEKVEKLVVEEKNEEKTEKKDPVEVPMVDKVNEEKAEQEKQVESVGEEKGKAEEEVTESAELVPSPSAIEASEKKDEKLADESTNDEPVEQTEKDSEKMDISQEEPVQSKKVQEDTVAEDEQSAEEEKTVQAEEELEKVESNTSEKSDSIPEEKEQKIVEEEVKSDDKESEEKVKPEVEPTAEACSESKEPVDDEKPVVEKEPKSSDAAQDEVFLIDDDDDEIVECKKEEDDKGEKKAEKRPCPDDDDAAEETVDAESAKKIRLSVELKDEVKSEEVKTEVKKEEKQSALELIEPLKTTLIPAPVAPKEKKAIRLEFLEKFKKPLEKMNRSNLEEFVLQKIVEGIAFKSTIAEMRTQLDAQDTLLQGYRQKVHDLNKQFRDLEMVHERVVKDLEKKNQHFITPVKITRAVGLQVSQPRFVAGARPVGNSTTAAATSPKGVVIRSPVSTPAGSPNKNPPQGVQNRRPTFSRIAPANMAQKPATQQPAVARPGLPTTISKPQSSPQTNLLNKQNTIQGQITPLNGTQQVQTTLSASQSPTTVATATATPPLTRKKPLQKYTPMRPPMSITQQVQQQQQTRQMQEQLMRQQIQDVQTSNTGGQSPVTQSPQGSPLTRTPEPASSPVGTPAPANRVSTLVVKKVTPQSQPAKPAPSNVVINRQNTSTVASPAAAAQTRSAPSTPTATTAPAVVDNSLIDLTDEDDVPKPAAQPTTTTTVVPKPPITILNGQPQQQQFPAQRQPGLPPLVVINQQRMMNRPTLQQRPPGMTNGAPPRPVLMQRPPNATNGFPRPNTYRARMINGQLGNRNVIARPPIRQQAVASFTHPAPLPQPGSQLLNPAWKQTPPRPSIRINNIETGIVISWTMDDLSEAHASIVSYQIYAYQETSAPPSMDMWRHVGDVKAMLLPMAVTLTQFQEGQRYHFAVRAVDEHQRVGQFSPPRTWNESAPAKA